MDRRNFLRMGGPLGTGALIGAASAPAQAGTSSFRGISVAAFGASGNGVDDDTGAVQDACNALQDNGLLYFPLGRYRITRPISIPPRSNIRIAGDGPGSVLFADAPMAELLRVWAPCIGGILEHLVCDANQQAGTGLRVLGGTYVRLDGLDIRNPKKTGIHCGAAESAIASQDLIIMNCRLSGITQPDAPEPGLPIGHGSQVGILVEPNWSFGYYNNLIIQGFVETGMELRADENILHEVHIYRFPAFQYKTALRVRGRHSYIAQCSFDNFTQTGVDVQASNVKIETCYFKRWSAAFGTGEIVPGAAVCLGSPDNRVQNIHIHGNSLYSEMPEEAKYAQSVLTAVQNVNAGDVISRENHYIAVNRYDQIIPGETVGSGGVEIPPGEDHLTVSHQLITQPPYIHLTPASQLSGVEYWVDDIAEKNFTIRLSHSSKRVLKFFWIT